MRIALRVTGIVAVAVGWLSGLIEIPEWFQAQNYGWEVHPNYWQMMVTVALILVYSAAGLTLVLGVLAATERRY